MTGPLPPQHCFDFHPLFDADVAGETPGEQRHRIAQAKALCIGCPVLELCDQRAAELHAAGEPIEGVWAGRWHPPIKAQRTSTAA